MYADRIREPDSIDWKKLVFRYTFFAGAGGSGAGWRSWTCWGWYWAGWAVALALVGWEFWIARKRERGPCFRAFLHNHWVGMAVFAGIALDLAFGLP